MVEKNTNIPQQIHLNWGLSRADHIYAHYLEDGMTRIVGELCLWRKVGKLFFHPLLTLVLSHVAACSECQALITITVDGMQRRSQRSLRSAL